MRELRRLSAGILVPHPSWHPYVPPIRACRDDFEQAIELAAADGRALDIFLELVEEEGDLEPAADAPPAVAAAQERLAALPVPEGQHPFLDEILPALEALRVLLVALTRSGAG